MEQFRKRVQELRELLAENLIDEETFQRGLDRAEKELAEARKRPSSNSNALLQRGSVEASRAILEAAQVDRGAEIEKKQLEEAKKQTEQLGKVAAFLINPLQRKETLEEISP